MNRLKIKSLINTLFILSIIVTHAAHAANTTNTANTANTTNAVKPTPKFSSTKPQSCVKKCQCTGTYGPLKNIQIFWDVTPDSADPNGECQDRCNVYFSELESPSTAVVCK